MGEGVDTAEEGMSGEKQRTEGQRYASTLGLAWLKDTENEMRDVKEDWRLRIKTILVSNRMETGTMKNRYNFLEKILFQILMVQVEHLTSLITFQN